ncbi:hypothetical protein GW17_00050415, partial [Ensete ventricosum]
MAWLPAWGGRLRPGALQGAATYRGCSLLGATTREHGLMWPAGNGQHARGCDPRLALPPAGRRR